MLNSVFSWFITYVRGSEITFLDYVILKDLTITQQISLRVMIMVIFVNSALFYFPFFRIFAAKFK